VTCFSSAGKLYWHFMESKSEITGGEDKVVKIDESIIRERKYQWGHKVKGQWVFGGVERDSSQTFVTVHDRSA